MLEWIKSFYNKDKLDEEMLVINTVHAICMVEMLIICLFVRSFVDDNRSIYLSFAMSVLIFLTILEINRTGKRRLPVIILSIALNFFYLPVIFFMFGRLTGIIPLYFITGIVYTILMLDFKDSLVLGGLEAAFYMAVICCSYFNMNTQIAGIDKSEHDIRYYAAMIAVIISGACAGVAVRYRYLFYKRECERADELKSKAVDAYVAKDMFLINMSHEIRTPMNAIVGYVDLLLDSDINEHTSEGAYNILNSCEALLAVTDELMDLSRAESGKVDLYCTDYDLKDLLSEIMNIMAMRLTESNLDFYADINNDIPRYLHGDASKIRQVIVNLLNNAVKFTDRGEIVLRADYRMLDGANAELVFEVEDTGKGIPREKIDKLFEIDDNSGKSKVYTEDSEGAGLGLAICKKVIDRMGGSISAESEYQVGSTFTVRVPQYFDRSDKLAYIPDAYRFSCLLFENDAEHTKYAAKIFENLGVGYDIAGNEHDFERLISINRYTHVFVANNRGQECEKFLNGILTEAKIVAIVDMDDNVQVTKANVILNRPVNIISVDTVLKNESSSYVREIMKKGGFACPRATILVVDDNFTNLNVASSLIAKYEAKVLTAVSGKDCLRIINENEVDMIFLDYMMPEMNGIDTLKHIREIPGNKFAALPVIALTANVVSGAREMFLEAGFDEYMAKPISIEKLEKTLRKYLPRELITVKNLQDNSTNEAN